MTDHRVENAAEIAALLDEQQLRDWLVEQRWYASKSRGVSSVELLERLVLAEDLFLALVQANFATGTHELYQLLLYSSEHRRAGAEPIVSHDGVALYDVISDPARSMELLRRIESGADLDTADGAFGFRRAERGIAGVGEDASVRAIGVEQSNSSIVFDEHLILKLFRKVESGINPELELLRFLTARDFPNIAPLYGWFEYEGASLAATLGVAQEFIPDGRDGWELALEEIVSDPDRFLERLSTLGAVTAHMHTALATDAGDPAFSPEEPSGESLSLLTATIDEEIERLFLRLPDDERVAPIAGRGQDVREQLAARSQIGTGGRQIRIHGDYHLGQTLDTPRGWVIIDFEGEPARPLPERRMKRSPLRDVASMLRSFAYATSAVALQRGSRGGRVPDNFEQRARALFLTRYFEEVDPVLLPAGEGPITNMLAIFELEKAVYELRYELDNRPDWVTIPVAGIRRLVEEP